MPWNNLVSAQNHAEDVVAPLTSNVCKMHPAALNAIACTCQQFVMSFPASKPPPACIFLSVLDILYWKQ